MTGGLGFFRTYRTVQRGKIARSSDLLLYLAANAEHGVVARDDTFVQPAFARLLRSKNITGVAIYGADGTLLFSKFPGRDLSLPTRITPPGGLNLGETSTLRAGSTSRLLVAPIYSTVYDAESITFGVQENIPANARLRGFAVMRITTALSAQELRDALFTGLILFLAVVVMGTIMALAAAMRITTPIANITRGIQRFTEGDLAARVPVSTHDEVGQIAHAFNRLAENLAQRMEELEAWSRTLEQEVTRRTNEIRASRKFLHTLISPLSGTTSDWETIAQEVLEGAEAVYCALYHRTEEGTYSLLATRSTVECQGAITPRDTEREITEAVQGSDGERLCTVTWFPMRMKDSLEGQLVLGYRGTSLSRGFVDQVLSALTITIVNIHSFDILTRLGTRLKDSNKTLKEQHEILIAQKQQIEETSKLKSQFLANVSHELRTPINAIIGYSEMITAGYYGEITAEQTERMAAIEESGRNLLNLINTILDHSRMEAGKLPLYVERIDDLRKLVKDTIGRNQSLTRERPYSIEFDQPDFPVPCVSDGGKIQQILTNLISNAVKFTEKGGVRVTLATRAHDIILSVKDTGTGIPETDLNSIFEAFKQVDGSSTRRTGGTGLGLSVSSSLALLIGGEISVESTPGEGSRFTLTIPRQIIEAN